MNSATSTDAASRGGAPADVTGGRGNPADQPPPRLRRSAEASAKAEAGSHRSRSAQSLQPWQFFVLAALMAATAATFMLRVNGIAGSVLLTALMFAAALVGAMGLRVIRPLFMADKDRVEPLSQRVRETLERDKLLTLRTIKELEFDHAMGKLSEADFKEMSGTLRTRAARLIQQIDSASGYRGRIERDLAARAADTSARRTDVADEGRSCPSCSTRNDADAKFCKNCGGKL